MEERLAWALNLDADVELGFELAGAYTPSRAVHVAMRPHVATLAASLLRPVDIFLEESEGEPLDAVGRVGRAFCPTPRALRLMARAGVVPEPHPSFDVLRRVNSRAFCSALGETLPGGAFVTTREALEAILESAPRVGSAWRVKHAFGMTGRNQRVLAPGSLAADDRAFVDTGLARGGVQVEPQATIREEYAMHGFVGRDGSLALGALVRQRCDARGAWVSSARTAASDDPGLARLITDETERVASALSRAGYFGPFGVDAYSYEGARGRVELQPRSEINARYSMGFVVGFGAPPAPLR